MGLTRSAAVEYAKRGIRVNAVGPEAIDTPMLDDFVHMAGDDPRIMEQIRTAHPACRDGTPHEVANAVVWLCSVAASFITGAMLMIDGGFSAQ